MKAKLSATLLICCAVLIAVPIGPTATLLENDEVKVIRALEKPHVKGKFHEHKMNRVMIYLQSGRQRFEYQDGRKPAVFDWRAGEVKWSAAGGLHSPEVVSNDPFNIVEVELKAPGTEKAISGELDPLKVDPRHYTLVFENAQVRVLRVRIEPGGVAPMHQHSVDRVTVFLTDQDFRSKDSTGKVEVSKHKAGDVVWGTPLTHTEENVSNKPFEVVTVEIKK
jgi:beta-alanine degradation protein BauB